MNERTKSCAKAILFVTVMQGIAIHAVHELLCLSAVCTVAVVALLLWPAFETHSQVTAKQACLHLL